MAESERQKFGPRLARLLGATPGAVNDGVATQLRPAVAMPEVLPLSDVAPEMPPLDGAAAATKAGEVEQAPLPGIEGRGGAPETAPRKHREAATATAEKRASADAPHALSQPVPQPLDEVRSLAKPLAEKIRPGVRQAVELASPQATVTAPVPDQTELRPTAAARQTASTPERLAAQPDPVIEPTPRREWSVDVAAAPASAPQRVTLQPPDPVQEPTPHRDRIVVVAAASPSETQRVAMEQPLSPPVLPVALNESGQEPLRATPDRSGTGDRTETDAAAPMPASLKTDPVTLPTISPLPGATLQAAPPLPHPSAPEGARSEKPRISPPERPPPPPVKIEIGELVISVRAPAARTQRPVLSTVRRAPRAHTIPLSGLGED